MKKIVHKVWGREEVIVNATYCGKILNLKRQYRCSSHYHQHKDETFYILSGIVLLEVGSKINALGSLGAESILLRPGDSKRVYPGKYHRFTGLTNSRIIEFSTKHYDHDNYRETKSEEIPNKEFMEIKKQHGMGRK